MSIESLQKYPPLVSVLALSWNNTVYLQHCLDCLTKQTPKDFEVIISVNGSIDASGIALQPNQADLSLIVESMAVHRGFAAARNIGANLAQGQWLALLDADIFPKHDWLEKLLCTPKENTEYQVFPSGQIQANAPALLDGTGNSYHITGLAWRRRHNKSSQEYGRRTEEVFSACPTAALYSREAFLTRVGFDEDDFSYFSVLLLNAMVVQKIGRIIFISTGGAVHGSLQYLPIDKQHPTNPLVSYGITKLTYLTGRPFDVPVNVLNNHLAIREMGWAPQVSLWDDIARTI